MFLIDYLSFSINFEGLYFEYVLNLLNLQNQKNNFVDLGALRRYEHCYKFGNINISTPYVDRDDMGIYVDMSGQGCREYEDMFTNLIDNYDWGILFKGLVGAVNNGVKINITRLDLAYDDFVGNLKMQTINRKLLKGEYVSRYKKWREIKTETVHSKTKELGKTYYIGSKMSTCYCKFYDKLAEMREKNKDDESVNATLDKLKHWVRFEITFKNDLAMLICNMILYSQDAENEVAQYINKCFRFIDKTKTRDENCPVSAFWLKFMQTDGVSKYRVIKSDLKGYDPAYKWFTKSLAPTLYALMCTYSSRNDFIKDIVINGGMRINQNHQQIMNFETTGKKYSNRQIWNDCYAQFNTYDRYKNDKLELMLYKPYG